MIEVDSRFRGNDGLRKTLGRAGGPAIAEGMGCCVWKTPERTGGPGFPLSRE